MILDRPIRFALRCTYRLLRVWWSFRRPRGSGAAVAVWHGGKLLLVRHSYRSGFSLPGGGVGRRETPVAAATRELREETGVIVEPSRLSPVSGGARSAVCGRYTPHVFEYRADRQPEIRIDNREIIEARFVDPGEAEDLRLDYRLRRYMVETGVRQPR